MKKLFVVTAILFGFIGAKAQNPFAQYGYTPKIATLSQGQYNEFFDGDTVVQIGSVLYNTKSQQIVAFIETDTLYSEATLEPDIVSRWLSPDPMAYTRCWVSPYNFVQNNPIIRIDPNGALDEVFITGPDAENTTAELKKSSSLEISRDVNTGKLSATGVAKTDADKILLEAINSETVVVNLETKSEATYDSKDGSKGWPLVPGGFEGSEVKDGKTIATQYINFGATQNIAKIVGEETGETITHEINEAFIGGRDYPGGDYSSAYQQSHTKAASADRVKTNIEFNKDTKSDPDNFIMQGRQAGSSTWTDIIKIPKK